MEKEKFNYKPYILTSGIILIFAGFAPFLFSKLSWGIEFSEKTGPIGDTIGGITAPFLSLIGSILVFAALRAQIQANHIVTQQFRREDQQKVEDVKNKMELLCLDLETIIESIKDRNNKIQNYAESEINSPFKLNLLRRSINNNFYRISQIEREAIYKGFKLYLSKNENWIKTYHTLYSQLDFLPAFFNDIYTKQELHAKDIFNQKNEVGIKIEKVLTLAANISKKNEPDYIEIKNKDLDSLYRITNNLLLDWYNFLKQENQKLKETNLNDASKKVFEKFINEALSILDESKNKETIMELISLVREIRTLISSIEFRCNEFGKNLLAANEKLVNDNDDKKSSITLLSEIKNEISLSLNY